MVNIGALVIYDQLEQPEITFGTNFKIGGACLLLGIISLVFSVRKW